ncbi:cell division protein FtsZ [Erythrobacter litoralis]|uniref:cell division protein FtsZ n=1 Tax=Erythrobacter litoralis TaxID=39960 RepID=UPI002435A991|nr:cell division protein FtsZ [Erythrobacter litoralis]MDG6077630.1 cell division protein FtsZ [Erythrobacter litoralis]
MSINIGPASSDELRPKIVVIGVGGAGGNAIANMMEAEIEGVDFIVSNTDAQALSSSPAERRIQLGPDITGGLGAGARPEVGKAAAEETVEDIEDALEGCNMCFIAAGMGGGTGTGAAPVIAEAARKKGVLTVGVVTKPFLFEGTRRMRAAEAGIDELQKHVDTLIVIPNQNLFLVAKAETTFKEAFMLADEVLQQGVRSITDLMVMPGLINLDFADVRSVMSEMGKAMMGTGEGEGDNRALEAAERAIANPLLDGVSMAGAKGVIISIIGGEDMKLLEVDEAANHIRELVDEDANIIWGSAFNPDLDGKIRVSVVATGIDESQRANAPVQPRNFSMSEARAPQRPVLDLPQDSGADEEEPFELDSGMSAEPEAESTPAPATRPERSVREDVLSTRETDLDDDAYDDEDDVDGIVDPLAGLRNEQTERFDRYDDEADESDLPAPADDSRFTGSEDGDDGWIDEDDTAERPPLNLSEPLPEEDGDEDELKLSPSQFSDDNPLATKPRKRPLLGGDDENDAPGGSFSGGAKPGAGNAPSQGSTLFERMANLSRGSSTTGKKNEFDDEDDDDEDGGALNIPRFLGRQNNQ